MYITKTPSKRPSGKTYYCILLRRSYREGGKVRNETLANLSNCSENEIKALERALGNKHIPKTFDHGSLRLVQGKKFGAAYVLSELAKRLNITRYLGNSFNGKLALFQVLARVLEQGSRLSATRLAQDHDLASVIGMERGFDENDLYDNLGWLAENQAKIEQGLFISRKGPVSLFLYDVTSSYFEGTENELAAFGYNRDGKKRKMQIVIGLLCDQEGVPVSAEVFRGNTQDVETFIDQIQKVTERFGCTGATFVGDRGMIKTEQITAIEAEDCTYITALTLPQLGRLIGDGVLKLDDFCPDLKEVVAEGARYIFRRNLERAKETMSDRNERLAKAQEKVNAHNDRLLKKSKTKLISAKKDVQRWLKKLYLDQWINIRNEGRVIRLEVDQIALAEKSKFDGCYVLKTNLNKDIPLRTVFERYKDLSMVEWAFRTCKTTYLDLRPIYVRTAQNTRGHVFVVMLAYMLVRELALAWDALNMTVKEGLEQLKGITRSTIHINEKEAIACIQNPNERSQSLLKAIGIRIPSHFEESQARVVSKKAVRESVVT